MKMAMNKKDLTETDICTKYITPAIKKAGWDDKQQIRQEVQFTDGRIIIKGDSHVRGEKKKADYVLYYQSNIPIAVVEAKKNTLAMGAGMQQALEYAQILDIPFVYSSNGDGFIEHDKTGRTKTAEKELSLDEFPSPEDLWKRYKAWKGLTPKTEKIVTQEYHVDAKTHKPRYYQSIAINRTVEAIAKGKDRILLVLATGTGKTYVASQIVYKLLKQKAKRRILYLTDRNILADQPRINDFKHFKGIMTKITKRKVDKSFELYFALYQGLSGEEEKSNIYKQFSPNFFDLVIVDECHRGSVKADSAWRDVLTYFKKATHIGMTATPKETKKLSNIDYFGKPIYTYSLKQGIDDGFLAPYRVVRIDLDKDLEGWRPVRDKKDKYGNPIPDRIYNSKDFEREMVLTRRTELVAEKITEFLKNTNRYAKTIVFCVDIEHAERMRYALCNENSDICSKNPRYVVKITGDDVAGKKELDPFIDPSSKYPVIATTSKLLNTGVDAQTCQLIVLDSNIASMTEFKQIIGRGTRIREDYGKFFFTIIDFRKVTNLFADPDFDGDPVQIYEPKSGEEIKPPIIDAHLGTTIPDISISEEQDKPRKYYVSDVEVKVINERVQYYDKDGKLITESLKDYTRKSLTAEYSSLDKFIKKWRSTKNKSILLNELRKQGILVDELRQEVGKEYDDFDLICHVAYDQKPLTRKERANKVRKRNYFTKYGDTARKVISALLDKYADEGIENIEDMRILSVNPFTSIGTPIEILHAFGNKKAYLEALNEVEQQIYGEE